MYYSLSKTSKRGLQLSLFIIGCLPNVSLSESIITNSEYKSTFSVLSDKMWNNSKASSKETMKHINGDDIHAKLTFARSTTNKLATGYDFEHTSPTITLFRELEAGHFGASFSPFDASITPNSSANAFGLRGQGLSLSYSPKVINHDSRTSINLGLLDSEYMGANDTATASVSGYSLGLNYTKEFHLNRGINLAVHVNPEIHKMTLSPQSHTASPFINKSNTAISLTTIKSDSGLTISKAVHLDKINVDLEVFGTSALHLSDGIKQTNGASTHPPLFSDTNFLSIEVGTHLKTKKLGQFSVSYETHILNEHLNAKSHLKLNWHF